MPRPIRPAPPSRNPSPDLSTSRSDRRLYHETALIRHSITEGFNNFVRHPLVTLASITTIALMLFLLGAFTVFSFNARQIMAVAGQQPPVEITLEIGVTEAQIEAIKQALAGNPNVMEFQIYTPEENFAAFKAKSRPG